MRDMRRVARSERASESQMMDVLNFIFQDGWHFVGVVVLIYAIGEAVAGVFRPRDLCVRCEDTAQASGSRRISFGS